MFPAAACHYPQKNVQVWGQPEDKNLQSLLLQNIFSRLTSRIQPVKKFYETTAFNISFFTMPVFLFL